MVGGVQEAGAAARPASGHQRESRIAPPVPSRRSISVVSEQHQSDVEVRRTLIVVLVLNLAVAAAKLIVGGRPRGQCSPTPLLVITTTPLGCVEVAVTVFDAVKEAQS